MIREFTKITQGRITLPESMRKKLGLKNGDPLMITLWGESIEIIPSKLAIKEEYSFPPQERQKAEGRS